MSKNGFLYELKGIAYDMVDNNGNFRTIPIGMIGTRKLSNDRIRLLQCFLSLIKDTDMVSNETKYYVFNRYITKKGVNEELNELLKDKGKQYKYNTTASKINYDQTKLEKQFGNEMLSDIILRTNNSDDIKRHTNNIIQAYLKYNSNKAEDLRNNIALELDKDTLCSELDDEKFKTFITVISPYLKSHMKMISSIIDADSVGYFNYLLYSPILSDVDKTRLDELKQLLDPSYIESEQIDVD